MYISKHLLKHMKQTMINQGFFLLCNTQNLFPNSQLDPDLKIKHFQPLSSWKDTEHLVSPSRVLSNLFWQELPWDQIIQVLGNINVFDTGCGSGAYSQKLADFSQNRIKSYKGVDVYEHTNWKNISEPQRTFETFSGKHITPLIPTETNFFMSQSAIEHFPNDKRFFSEINEFILKHRDRPIMQVHLFPSVACMRLYGRHGYRQYTPRSISRISELFSDSTRTLFGLGGPACTDVHQTFIANPNFHEGIDYRKTKPEEYIKKLQEAILSDKYSFPHDPSFWALIISSNFQNQNLF